MIVYLATYPRSGHAVCRGLLFQNFGLLVANGYAEAPVRPKAKFQLRDAPVCEPGFPAGLRWSDWTITYRNQRTGVRQRGLKNDVLSILTPGLRESLAEETNIFVIKTHERPFERYFRGEAAIQMTRHPGAALASFVKMVAAYGAKGATGLPEAIRGEQVSGGSWSGYHEAWLAADLPRLTLRYEDAVKEPAAAVASMAAALGLDAPEHVIAMPIERARALNPRRNPGAGEHGWRGDFTESDLELLRRLHGRTASRLGYDLDT